MCRANLCVLSPVKFDSTVAVSIFHVPAILLAILLLLAFSFCFLL